MIELLLLDRDGVLNKKIENGYVTNVSQLTFIKSTFDFLRQNSFQFKYTGVVTNQQGIGKRLFSQEDLGLIHKKMSEQFCKSGLEAPTYFVCPHLSRTCECRKPKPGLILDALTHFKASPNRTLMIGDSASDVLAANAAGISAVHLSDNCEKDSCLATSHTLSPSIFKY